MTMTSFSLVEDACARLCHDLGGPLGGVTGALDLIGGSASGEAVAVAREGGAAMRARLRLWRAAVGGGAGPMGRGTLAELLEGSLGRATVDAEGLGDAELSPGMGRAALLGAMLGAEALPRGGVVRIGGTRGEVAILPERRGAAWPPHLTAALAGEAVTGPRAVLAPLLLAVCAGAGVRPALAFGMGGAAAPLLLSSAAGRGRGDGPDPTGVPPGDLTR